MELAEVSIRAGRWRDELSRLVDEIQHADALARTTWILFVPIAMFDLYQYYRRGIFGLDFANVWAAGHALLHHRTKWSDFVYLPGSLIFVFPLAALSLRLARLVIYVAQFLGLGYAFWAITRITRQSLGSRRVAGFAVVLAVSGQVGIASNYENFTLLLVPLAAAFFLAVDRGHPTAAAIALGVSLTIKPFLLPLLLVLALHRLWRCVAVAVLIPTVLTALAFLVITISGSPATFLHEVIATFGSNNVAPVNMSISGVGHILSFPAPAVSIVRVATGLVCVDACRRMWSRPFGGPGERVIWLTAPLLVGMILCFTFAWAYYAVLFIPLTFLTLERKDWAGRLIQVGVFLALFFPILPDLINGYPRTHPSDYLALLGLLVLLAGLEGISIEPHAVPSGPSIQNDIPI
jgi:arabinofuranan 3-O-arabinosyltransferase